MVTMNGYLFALILSLLGVFVAGAYFLGIARSRWEGVTRDVWDGFLFSLGGLAAVAAFVCILNLVLAGAGVVTL